MSDMPTVVCICGSTRFADAMNTVGERLTLLGKIVVRPEVVAYDGHRDPQLSDPSVKERLDELHLRKIDLADEVFVVNVDGYVGDSTRREIAYALREGKPGSVHERGHDMMETAVKAASKKTGMTLGELRQLVACADLAGLGDECTLAPRVTVRNRMIRLEIDVTSELNSHEPGHGSPSSDVVPDPMTAERKTL